MQNPNTSNGAPDYSEAFVDLAQRLRDGERNVAASILSSNSSSAADEEFAIDIAYREFLVLKQLGDVPDISEFCGRFPKYKTRLNRLLELDHEFESLTGYVSDQTFFDGAEGDTIEDQNLGQKRIVGRYELLHQIGYGGSSRVYKARQIGLDRVVAIKLLNINIVDDQQQKRFRREAELIARLQHPNIVQLFDYGCEDEQFFLVLELVNGGGLDQKTEDSMTVDEICRLMIKLTRAIHFAHHQNIIHRDLKPSNILMASGDEPKIADFGLAKNLEASDPSSATKTGTTLGTPSYMAPEQVAGESASISPATDIYGLGAILYQMLTGRPPFVAGNVLETLRLVRETEPVQPSSLRPKLPRDLEVICLRCLNKEPAKRFVSAEELAIELQRFSDGVPIQSRAAGGIEKSVRWCRRRPLVASLYGALATAIIIGFFGITWQWREANAQAILAESKHQKSQENFEDARKAIDRLTETSRELSSVPGTDKIREQALREVLAFYLEHVDESDDPDVAFETADTYRRISQIRADLYQYADAVNGLTKANQILNQLREQFPENAKYDTSLAENFFSLGLHLKRLQKTSESADHFLASAELYHSCWITSNSDHFQLHRARALNNASNIYFYSGSRDRAINLNEQAGDLFQAHENESSLFWLCNYALVVGYKAVYLDRKRRFTEAITFFEKAVKLLEKANKFSDVDAEISDDLAQAHYRLARAAHVVQRSNLKIWSHSAQRATELFKLRWQSRPDRPAIGKEYAKACWAGAKQFWFIGETEIAEQWYRDTIETLDDIKTRFPGFSHTLSPDHDEISYWLTLLWATCPVEELRDYEAALELSRKVLEERPESRHARIAFTVAEAVDGDIEIAADMLESEPWFQTGSPINGRLLTLLVRYRRGETEISESDMAFLRKTRVDGLDYGGIARQLSERILQMIESNH